MPGSPDGGALHGQGGTRPDWTQLPVSVRKAIEAGIRGRIAAAHSQSTGFSPGVAARVVLDDGRRIFVKAAGPDPNPQAPAFHRQEARITAALPPDVPAPRLLFTHDDGEWVALVLEDVDGTSPRLPWEAAELTRVLAAMGELADGLTPSPVDAPAAPTVLGKLFGGWRELADTGAVTGLGDWARRHLSRLIDLEGRAEMGAAGTTLLHQDIRADNILLTPERVVFIDWPHAAVGAAWLDLLLMLPSVGVQGGPRPWEVFSTHRVSRNADPPSVTGIVCGLAGFYLARSVRPAPPGVPNVRAFQRAQAEEALAWLQVRTGTVWR